MPKANIIYAHLADQVFPSEGGKLNVIGIFGGLNGPGRIGMAKFPAVYPRLALAVGLSTTEKQLPVNITFRSEDGKDVVPPFSGTFEIQRTEGAGQKEAANVNFNLNFDAFQIQGPGKLFITVESGEDELAELEIDVIQAQAPTQPAPPPAGPQPQTPPAAPGK